MLSDEVPDTLLALLLQELFKSVRAKVVEELPQVLFLLVTLVLVQLISRSILATNMEVDSDIDGNHHVVFCWNVADRALEPNCVLCDHNGDSISVTKRAETKMQSRLHDSYVYSISCTQNVNTIWDVQARCTAFLT